MANKLKLSASYYWDASGVIVRSYVSPNSSTLTKSMNSSRTLKQDFRLVDCGGFMYSTDASDPKHVDVAKGDTKDWEITFAAPFTSAPDVVCCLGIQDAGKNVEYSNVKCAAIDVTSSKFKARVPNNSTNGFGISYFWIAVGDDY